MFINNLYNQHILNTIFPEEIGSLNAGKGVEYMRIHGLLNKCLLNVLMK